MQNMFFKIEDDAKINLENIVLLKTEYYLRGEGRVRERRRDV